MSYLSAYTDQHLDTETALHYMNARYYDSDLKRFTSIDPVAVNDVMRAVNAGPQTLNPYSYVSKNPLRYTDPTGEWFKEVLTGQQSLSDFQLEVGQATVQMTNDSQAWDVAVSNPKTTGAAIGVGSGVVALGASTAAGGGLVLSGDATGTLITNTGVRSLQTRDAFLRGASNPLLRKQLHKLYQASDKLPGGTAGAVKNELLTGLKTGGRNHIQKANDTINSLNRVLRNTQSTSKDVSISNTLIKQLSEALKTKK